MVDQELFKKLVKPLLTEARAKFNKLSLAELKEVEDTFGEEMKLKLMRGLAEVGVTILDEEGGIVLAGEFTKIDFDNAELAKKQKEASARYAKDQAAKRDAVLTKDGVCPKCGKAMGKIMYGLPNFTPELRQEIEEGKIILGGCILNPDSPQLYCKQCGIYGHKSPEKLNE